MADTKREGAMYDPKATAGGPGKGAPTPGSEDPGTGATTRTAGNAEPEIDSTLRPLDADTPMSPAAAMTPAPPTEPAPPEPLPVPKDAREQAAQGKKLADDAIAARRAEDDHDPGASYVRACAGCGKHVQTADPTGASLCKVCIQDPAKVKANDEARKAAADHARMRRMPGRGI